MEKLHSKSLRKNVGFAEFYFQLSMVIVQAVICKNNLRHQQTISLTK